jgi:hypothetical protein
LVCLLVLPIGCRHQGARLLWCRKLVHLLSVLALHDNQMQRAQSFWSSMVAHIKKYLAFCRAISSLPFSQQLAVKICPEPHKNEKKNTLTPFFFFEFLFSNLV